MSDFASLVVLSYNRADYIRRSLQSMRANTTYPHQLIVADDGSDEATQGLLYWGLRLGLISTLLLNSGHNMGIGIQVNRGMECARGNILAKLDADLDYTPGWLERAVGLLQSHDRIGVLGLFKYHHAPCNFPDEHPVDHGDHYEVDDFVGSALLFRRDVWDKFGPWIEVNRCFAEDVSYKQKVQAGGYYLALPKDDLAVNFGFGEQHSSLIKKIDWSGAGQHDYNIPDPQPLLLGCPKKEGGTCSGLPVGWS